MHHLCQTNKQPVTVAKAEFKTNGATCVLRLREEQGQPSVKQSVYSFI